MSEIHNILLPEFFFEYMEHWGAKQVKQMLFAVRDYALKGIEPVFDSFDDETNMKMTKHFNLVSSYITKSLKNYKVKALISQQKIG